MAGLDADVDSLHAPEAKVASGAVQHDGAAGVNHVCLEEDFVDYAVVVDDVEFVYGKVQTPISQVLINDVDGVVLESGVEAGTFEYLAQNSDCVD